MKKMEENNKEQQYLAELKYLDELIRQVYRDTWYRAGCVKDGKWNDALNSADLLNSVKREDYLLELFMKFYVIGKYTGQYRDLDLPTFAIRHDNENALKAKSLIDADNERHLKAYEADNYGSYDIDRKKLAKDLAKPYLNKEDDNHGHDLKRTISAIESNLKYLKSLEISLPYKEAELNKFNKEFNGRYFSFEGYESGSVDFKFEKLEYSNKEWFIHGDFVYYPTADSTIFETQCESGVIIYEDECLEVNKIPYVSANEDSGLGGFKELLEGHEISKEDLISNIENAQIYLTELFD